MTATCPKCNGTGHLTAFAHIANGDCFMCGGTGRVEASKDAGTVGSEPRGYKTVQLPGIGSACIWRGAVGFIADVCDARGNIAGRVWFSVKAGRVVVNTMSDGIRGRDHQYGRALQAAYRG